MSKSKNNESKLAPKYRIENDAWINVLREKRHKKGRDFKVIITSRNSTTGTGKTTLALWLALNWDNNFTADQATLHVAEYNKMYTEQSPGSVLIMDEAEQVDARRSMSHKNVNFTEAWSMNRVCEVDTILTLPTISALDKRVEELADVWINVIERGYAEWYEINVDDRSGNVEQFKMRGLRWPDISHLSVAKEVARKKDRKIEGEIYRDDTAEEDNKEREKEYQLRLAQRLRNEGKTLREIADDAEIDYSYQWVNQNTEKPD
jgi:broad-specificity NMP kinase